MDEQQKWVRDVYGRVVFIEFDSDNRPFSVQTEIEGGSSQRFDFAWCQRDHLLYFHCSSAGGRDNPCYREHDTHNWWAAEGYCAKNSGMGDTGKRVELPTQYATPEAIFLVDADEGDTVYCAIHNDEFPDDDVCEHIYFCEKCGQWSVPGERCHYRNGRKAYRKKQTRVA